MPIFNISAALVIGSIKNGLVAFMASAYQLEQIDDIKTRFLGGAFMGVSMLATFAAISGARSEHKLALVQLASVQRGLLGSKDNVEQVLKDELEKLQARSRETVLPKIKQIEDLLVDDSRTGEIIDVISDTVSNRVRPLMSEISERSIQGFSGIDEDIDRKIRVHTPKRFVIRDAIRPGILFAYLAPGLAMLMFFFVGLWGALFGFVAGTLAAGLHWLFRLSLPKRDTPRGFNFLALTAVAILLPIPSLFFLGMNLPYTRVESYVAPIVSWVLMILVPVTLSPMFILEIERVKIEKQIQHENQALSKELTIFEQRLWVFKRRWLLMLHGTVQGALTAALTRLKTFSDTDPYQAGLVRADLERVVKALQTIPSEEIDFDVALEELKASWEGICSIRVNVDMRAERALKVSDRAAYCVNEIMKEAIGNAVRHGEATAATIDIVRLEEDAIELQIQNNGKVPRKNRKKGIGSRMLDDITTEWTLSSSGKLTTLRASLPL